MLRLAPSLALAAVLALGAGAPAFAADEAARPASPSPATPASASAASGLGGPVTLSAQEIDAVKLKLIQAKPNVSTVAITSFLAPGSAQALMGHVDRSFMLWGGYLLGFTALKVAIPAQFAVYPGGPRTSDVAVGSLFLGIAALSAIDAAMLASKDREEYDKFINRLTDKEPLPHGEVVRP